MNKGVWAGNHIPDNNRILILGESHYGSSGGNDNKYKDVDYDTSEVLEEYYGHKAESSGKHWDRFFDRIAESFGYSTDTVAFYDKVVFGNYVDKFCGVRDETAENVIKAEYQRLNHDLFSFINENQVSILVCFSILAYNQLPARAIPVENPEKRILIGQIGNRQQYLRKYLYRQGVTHDRCDLKLNSDLLVYGIPHPSARGGYDASKVYEVLRQEAALNSIIREAR